MSKTVYDYINEMKNANIIRPRVKVELLYPNEQPFYNISPDIDDSNGNLTISYTSGIRRNCQLTINNETLKYFINPNSLYINQKFRLSLGLQFQNSPEEILFPQGVFVFDTPSVVSNQSLKQISFSGVDKFGLLDSTLGTQLKKILYYPKNTNSVAYIIRQTLISAGDNIIPVIDVYYETIFLPYDLIIDIGEHYSDVFLNLAKSFTADCFYDSYGRLNFRQGLLAIQDSLKSPLWNYSISEQEYLDSKVDYNFNDVYNEILVLGQNINGTATVSYLAQNTNPQSPTNIYKIKPRTRIIKDDMIVTVEQAKIRAEYELRLATMVAVNCSISSIPLYHLEDVACLVSLTDPAQKFELARLFVQTINLPINSGGNMSLTCTNTNELT